MEYISSDTYVWINIEGRIGVKKAISLLVMLVMILTFAGCGESGKEDPIEVQKTEYQAMEVDGVNEVYIDPMPKSLSDIVDHIDTDDPVNVCAFFMAGLVRASESWEDGLEIMDEVCASKSPFEDNITEGMPEKDTHKQWLKEAERNYIPRSYYKGSTPENGYTPDSPWTLVLTKNEAQTTDYNTTAANGYKYVVYDIQSSGRDTSRQLVLFQRPGETRWYMNSFSGILTTIQPPK